MPPGCCVLGRGSTPSSPQFRFLDLSADMRYMVYEELMDRHAWVRCPEMEVPDSMAASASVQYCFHPELLRTNRQIAQEYRPLAIRKMRLAVYCALDTEDTPGYSYGYMREWPSIPRDVLAKIRFLALNFCIQSAWDYHDYFPNMTELVNKMPKLCFMEVLTLVSLQGFFEQERDDLQAYRRYGESATQELEFFKSLVRHEKVSYIIIRHELSCDLYEPWTEAVTLNSDYEQQQEEDGISEAVFGICLRDPVHGQQFKTAERNNDFDLHGLMLRFRGTREFGLWEVGASVLKSDHEPRFIYGGSKPISRADWRRGLQLLVRKE